MLADKLRKSVLQSAIQGKLTEQLATDDNVEDLLQAIKEEKELLIKEKKIKKQKPLPKITEDEIPFAIPENWKWVRLGEITDYGIGKSVKYDSIPVDSLIIELEDIEKNTFKLLNKNRKRTPKSSKNKFQKGDILFGKLRPYLKKIILIDEDGFCSTEIVPISSFNKINQKYLMMVLVSPKINEFINNLTYGMDMPRLGTTDARLLLIPLPPLAEQKRIVEKLDNVLANIDELKDNEEKLSILQKNFPDKLKKSILQSAIQGNLTEQLATDDKIEDLLKAIKEEKECLIKEKKIKKQKPLSEITEEEIPFVIPENWKWVRLGEVILLNMGQSPNSEDVGNDGIEFHQGKIYFTDEIIGFSDKYCSKPKKISNANEILLSVRAPVGEVNLNNREICIGRGLASIKIINSEERYFFYLLFYCKKIFEKKSTGTTFKAISKDIIENLLIPLPPLAEQKRIVEKLDKLLADIEELKIE
ncbi:restriction endonuclease subunit S [Megamonas funiformis]|uniref:restriction endonuclease subunit S n=1 Tax=Megamonas funiformis TaxID=437897 RepID=UPI003565CF59